MPAVKIREESDYFVPTGKGSCKAQRQMGGFSTRCGEPYTVGAWNESLNNTGPRQFVSVIGAKMGALVERFMNCRKHFRMPMAEQQCTVATEVINILMAVHIPFSRSLCTVDKHAVGSKMSRIMGNSAWKLCSRIAGECS